MGEAAIGSIDLFSLFLFPGDSLILAVISRKLVPTSCAKYSTCPPPTSHKTVFLKQKGLVPRDTEQV